MSFNILFLLIFSLYLIPSSINSSNYFELRKQSSKPSRTFPSLTSRSSSSSSSQKSSKPNIIIFLADDLGWDDVGFHGSQQISTPNIDSLAADGIILNEFYAQPLCTPSRGALLSSVHPIHSGTQHYVILSSAPWGLPLKFNLLPEQLKKLGYENHMVGKWHLGFFQKEYTPTFRGFDSHTGYWTGAEDYYDHTAYERECWGLDFRNNLDLITDALGIYSTDYFTLKAINIIQQHNKSNPLFLYMAYQSVHTSSNGYSRLQAPQELINKFNYISNQQRRTFAAMTYSMDQSIGLVIDKLHRENMLENSIVIFISDNGGPASGFTGNAASNWPLRGVKQTLWEGGVRVAGFIWSKLLSKKSFVYKHKIHMSDLAPTILQAIGSRQTKLNHNSYGIPLWNQLTNNLTSPRQEILHNIDPIWNVSAIRFKNWKLIQGLVYPDWNQWYPPFSQNNTSKSFIDYQRVNSLAYKILTQMKRRPNFNLFNDAKVNCGPKPKNATSNCDPLLAPCLFDIDNDPCEFNNLADEQPLIVKFLWNRILQINQTAIDPGTKPNDPDANPILHNYAWSCWKDN